MVDHDQLIQELLTTFFAEFVELFLPDVAAVLDRNSLTFQEGHEIAVVVRARLGDQDAFLLVHVENRFTPRADFGERMFRSFARLFEEHGLPIYPVVLFAYAAPTRREPDHFTIAFPGFTPVVFRYRAIQLNRLFWREFAGRANPVASALMARMRIAPQDRPLVKRDCLRSLAALRLDPARIRLLSSFIDAYLPLKADELRTFDALLAATEPDGEREFVMQIITSWMREGIEQGRQEGMAEMALRLLRRRFGATSPDREIRIAHLSTAALVELGEALPDFAAPADVDVWLDRREH